MTQLMLQLKQSGSNHARLGNISLHAGCKRGLTSAATFVLRLDAWGIGRVRVARDGERKQESMRATGIIFGLNRTKFSFRPCLAYRMARRATPPLRLGLPIGHDFEDASRPDRPVRREAARPLILSLVDSVLPRLFILHSSPRCYRAMTGSWRARSPHASQPP